MPSYALQFNDPEKWKQFADSCKEQNKNINDAIVELICEAVGKWQKKQRK